MSVCKKITSLLIAVILSCIFLSCPLKVSALSISASSAVLIDAQSGKVLFEKNSKKILPMASTTKIMTAVVAIESGSLERTVIVSKESVGIEGSSIYLCEGEKLTLEQLLYALMLSSANDAATAIAIAVAGSETAFSDIMNKTATKIGLTSTHFDNPHGLDSESHYTTAYDLAKLTAYALKLPKFKAIVSTYKHQIPLAGKENARLLVNHNKLLRSYEGIIGVKTGYTKRSGRCLVSAAERNGLVLIAVTLNAPDDWKDHKTMLNYGFDNYESVELTFSEEMLTIPVVSGTKTSVVCSQKEKLSSLLSKDHGAIICRIELKRFTYAPVNIGEKVGQIIYFCDGEEIGRSDITTKHHVGLIDQRRTIWDTILDFFKK